MLHRSPAAAAALIVLAPTTARAQSTVQYPPTRATDHVDVYHGTRVADPYRWLEQSPDESAEVAEWITAQNEVTFDYLHALPHRDAIEDRLTKLWNYERYSTPFKAGGRYYFFRNDGLQNQDVLYVQPSLQSEATELLNPNTWSADGTVALSGTSFTDDGRYMAYGLAEAGSDWQRWKVRDIEAGTDLADEVRWIKFGSPVWTRDGRGFFYNRYDEPSEGDEHQSVNQFMKLAYHRLGTSQDRDVLVYHRPDQPSWGFNPEVTEDGRYLVITVWKGTDDEYMVLYKDLDEPYGMPIELIDRFEADYTFLGNDGPVFYFRTNLDAPLGRIIAIDTLRPQREHWRELVPESERTLRGVNIVGNMFVASYLDDAKTAVELFTLDGTPVRSVDLPGIGSASGFGGRRGHTETFYSFSSFATPPSTYRYDLVTGESELLRRANVDMDPDDYVVRQVFYESKDGTRVPMFITHRKDVAIDGNAPTLLYGYGGFNIPLTPGFSVSRLGWMEMGGVYAVANLRGGGEYGERWHEAGTRLQKQNVFDDFIAAAEWLIDNGYTQPQRLAIQGGSNGGLLVGACMTQRPDLYGACLPAVGVMDMLRFHEFTIGWAWVDDYGSSADPDEFTALRAYSPYHNVRPASYPATLITTADTDDRVVPAHSFKFAAALQAAQEVPEPVLIRIETRAGHAAGKPTSKRIEELADQLAFLVENLGMQHR